jgi:hypothetical protein
MMLIIECLCSIHEQWQQADLQVRGLNFVKLFPSIFFSSHGEEMRSTAGQFPGPCRQRRRQDTNERMGDAACTTGGRRRRGGCGQHGVSGGPSDQDHICGNFVLFSIFKKIFKIKLDRYFFWDLTHKPEFWIFPEILTDIVNQTQRRYQERPPSDRFLTRLQEVRLFLFHHAGGQLLSFILVSVFHAHGTHSCGSTSTVPDMRHT